MIKEALSNVPLGEFLKGDTEEWRRKWQDPNFTHTFPANVQRFLSQDGHTQFLKEHGEEVIRSAVSAFMQLPWNPREEGCIAVNAMNFTENGEVIPLKRDELVSSRKPTVDSLIRTEIALLPLLGFGPSNQEGTKIFIITSYQNPTPNRRVSFRDNVFKLITDNNITRKWIKTNQLDTKNGFVWDKDVPTLALSLAPPRHKSSNEGLRVLPNELLHPEQFPGGVIDVFIDYAINHAKSLPTINPKRKDLHLFIFEVEKRPDRLRYEEKLTQLKELLRPR